MLVMILTCRKHVDSRQVKSFQYRCLPQSSLARDCWFPRQALSDVVVADEPLRQCNQQSSPGSQIGNAGP